eukprot:evm.model.scf_1902.1 EVM.evm.TU.scf_1902.1   scf_1902:3212-15097(+)
MSFEEGTQQEGNSDGKVQEQEPAEDEGTRLIQVGSLHRQISSENSVLLMSAILEGANDEVQDVLARAAPVKMKTCGMYPLYDVPEGTDIEGLMPELYEFDTELETGDSDIGPYYIPERDMEEAEVLQEMEALKEAMSPIKMLERGQLLEDFHDLPAFHAEGRFGDSEETADTAESDSYLAGPSTGVSESSEMTIPRSQDEQRKRSPFEPHMSYARGHEGLAERGESGSNTTTAIGRPHSSLTVSTYASDVTECAYAIQMMDALSLGQEDAYALANQGISANTKDRRGRTVLMKAAMGGNREFVNALINTSTNLDMQDKAGYTALMWAAVSGQDEIVSLLLDKNANIDIQNKYGSTALMMAAMNGKLAIVNILMSSSPNLDVQDKFGRTALMKAAMNAKLDVVNALISSGADIDIQEKTGDTALMTAATVGNLEIAQVLISCNAELDLQDENGQTALMKAAAFGRTEIVNALITSSASLDMRDKAGETALMHAAMDSNLLILDALITAGVDMNDEDEDGRTTLMRAAVDGHLDVVNLLIQSGANVHVPDKMGQTAVQQATKMGHREIARILRREGTYKDVTRSMERLGISAADIRAAGPPSKTHRPDQNEPHSVDSALPKARSKDAKSRQGRFQSMGSLPDTAATSGRQGRGSLRVDAWRTNSTRDGNGATHSRIVTDPEEDEEEGERLGPLGRLGRMLRRATSSKKRF